MFKTSKSTKIFLFPLLVAAGMLLSLGTVTMAVDPPASGMVFWVKADAGTMKVDPADPNAYISAGSGEQIDLWQDQSGNNNHANRVLGDQRNVDKRNTQLLAQEATQGHGNQHTHCPAQYADHDPFDEHDFAHR